MLDKLPTLFELIDDLFSRSQPFDAYNYKGTISIAINTSLYRPVSRRLYQHLRPLMPKATLKIINWGQDTEHDLKLAKVHLGINYLPLDISKQVLQKKIAHCYFKLICREGHPVLKTERTTQDIGQYPLALLELPDFNKRENLIETKLREFGITPIVGLRADQLSICLHVVSQTDSLMPCVDIFDVDLPAGTTFFSAHKAHQLDSDIGIFIPNKLARAPLNRWLLNEVQQVFITENNS